MNFCRPRLRVAIPASRARASVVFGDVVCCFAEGEGLTVPLGSGIGSKAQCQPAIKI
jgi:hypothetical protein